MRPGICPGNRPPPPESALGPLGVGRAGTFPSALSLPQTESERERAISARRRPCPLRISSGQAHTRPPPPPPPSAGTRPLRQRCSKCQGGEASLPPAPVRLVQPHKCERARPQSNGAGLDPQRSREAGRPGSWHPKEAAGSPRRERARSPGRWATPDPPPSRPDLRPSWVSWSPRRGR